jgi:hypothetical protein
MELHISLLVSAKTFLASSNVFYNSLNGKRAYSSGQRLEERNAFNGTQLG